MSLAQGVPRTPRDALHGTPHEAQKAPGGPTLRDKLGAPWARDTSGTTRMMRCSIGYARWGYTPPPRVRAPPGPRYSGGAPLSFWSLSVARSLPALGPGVARAGQDSETSGTASERLRHPLTVII